MDRIGEKLQILRTRQGLSVRQLARELGVSGSYITQIELGKKTPSAKLVEKMSRTFNVMADVLMKDELELDD